MGERDTHVGNDSPKELVSYYVTQRTTQEQTKKKTSTRKLYAGTRERAAALEMCKDDAKKRTRSAGIVNGVARESYAAHRVKRDAWAMAFETIVTSECTKAMRST